MAIGCEATPTHPPQTLAELQYWRSRPGEQFTPRSIVLHNVERVLSRGVPAGQRVESLRVLVEVGEAGADTYPALASALSEPQTPLELRMAVLAHLAANGYPGLGEYVVAALPHAKDAKLRSGILEWLAINPTPGVLSEVVKLWASDAGRDEGDELRYRQVVTRMAGVDWEDALVTALNTEDFLARGSAIEVLAARVPETRLKDRICALEPGTQAVRAMQYFVNNYGYVPKTRRELLAAVMAFATSRSRLAAPALLAQQWQSLYGYRFNIRDFHLLDRLAADPLRSPLPRGQLKLELARAIGGRTGGAAGGGSRGRFRRGQLVDFDSQAEILSMADLWNLALVNEMMGRYRFKLAMNSMIGQDRADRRSQWGGLVTYEQGQAEAKLYRPGGAGSDTQYVPAETFVRDSLDCLCYFVGHFSQDESDPTTVGPTKEELTFAAEENLYGLVLTRMVGGKVNATYFSPKGFVVDMGDFDLAQ